MLVPRRLLATVGLAGCVLGVCTARGAASVAAAAPTCTPATLDGTAQLDGAVTVSPMPGARDAPPATQISFLGVPARKLSDVRVVGAISGSHPGSLQPYSDGDGGSFVPRSPFRAGERVLVSARVALADGGEPLSFGFTVARPDPVSTASERLHPLGPGGQQHFRSRPDLEPPVVFVHRRSSRQSPGDTFLAPYDVAAPGGPMILAPSGGLVWFEPLKPPTVATNLRVQRYAGAPALTWWQGTITTHGYGIGADEIDSPSYERIAVVKAGNGLAADLHEFQITPGGAALISAYYPIRCDLSALGGSSDAAVTDSLLQEIDIRTGLVMFQWSSVDHIALSDSYSTVSSASAAWPFDFFHLNSINLDGDGSLLVSSRNTWAVDDIDAASGQVRWTLGGKSSSFAEGAGATTAFQHDARPVGGDAISLFDNGASPQEHQQSRGVVLALDEETKTVSVREQFLHPGHPLLADSQGDLQALSDGSWFVGWGQEPDLSEFSSNGTLLFDASLPSGYASYRALSFPWSATPVRPPALAVTRRDAYASWNGATGVARWELREGPSRGRLAHVGTVGSGGFETTIPLIPSTRERYAQVRAIDARGRVLANSDVQRLPPAAGSATAASSGGVSRRRIATP
jgi:Arylsulfotransferase (ASST)